MADAAKFWNRLADKYHRSPIPDEAIYQTKLEATRALFRSDMDVLELGCGTGGTAILHAPYVRHIRAVDFSEAMLEKGREQLQATGVTNVTFEQADIAEMTLPRESYDVVLAMSILHLLDNPDAMIAKGFAALKPGGHFVSSTACIGDMAPLLAPFVPLASIGRTLGLLPVINVMTAQKLVGKFEAAGFDIVHRWQPGKNKAFFMIAQKPR